MLSKNLKILAIETSCDETAAAVIGTEELKNLSPDDSEMSGSRPKRRETKEQIPIILSNVVSSQVNLHALTGGVVPEVASRAHMESILPVIQEALAQARYKKQDTSYKQISNFKSQKLKAESYKLKADALSEITHIAVTNGPGLVGSLLVGFNTAKSLAYSLDLPIVPINHIEGHIYSAIGGECQMSNVKCQKYGVNHYPNEANQASEANEAGIEFPILALTVSGGHTSLTLMLGHGKYKTIGATRDDAAGEAFDKVAKLLDLGYPGGPIVSKLADKFRRTQNSKLKPFGKLRASSQNCNLKTGKLRSERADKQFNNLTIKQSGSLWLPRPMIKDKSYDFSFSGLKTAVLDVVRQLESPTKLQIKRNYKITNKKKISHEQKAKICAAFEDATVDVLVTKTLRAAEKYQPKAVILAGGVAANKRLREELANRLQNYKLQNTNHKQAPNSKNSKFQNSNLAIQQFNNINLLIPSINLCGDNAAMIGLAAYYHIVRGDVRRWNEIKVDSNMKL